MKGEVRYITKPEATAFLLPRHYSGRKPTISYAFGWYFKDVLKAVLTVGKPANHFLCTGVCGKENAPYVYELNRLCRENDLEEPLSQFVSACLRRLAWNNDLIIVSYADTGAGHNGYVYQATNFLYTGKTKERLEFHNAGKHSRHGSADSEFRQIRTAKHRYVFFATRNKKLKKQWRQALKYPVEPYPKEPHSYYELGTVLEPTVVKVGKK